MIPFRAFRIPVVAVSSVGNLLMGVVMFALLSYVPLFAQGVRGESASGATAVLTPMLLGWACAASVSGRLYVRVGFRRAALIGTGLTLLGTLPLMLLTPASPLLFASIGMGFAGLGFGVTSPAFLLAPQSAVPWNLRGVVTSSTQFFRTIGGSIGVALMGALLTSRLVDAASVSAAAADADGLINKLLNVQQRAQIPAEQLATLTVAMAAGLHVIFLILAGVALVAVLQVVLFAATPRDAEAEPIEPKFERANQRA
jgi:MFS family permease